MDQSHKYSTQLVQRASPSALPYVHCIFYKDHVPKQLTDHLQITFHVLCFIRYRPFLQAPTSPASSYFTQHYEQNISACFTRALYLLRFASRLSLQRACSMIRRKAAYCAYSGSSRGMSCTVHLQCLTECLFCKSTPLRHAFSSVEALSQLYHSPSSVPDIMSFRGC